MGETLETMICIFLTALTFPLIIIQVFTWDIESRWNPRSRKPARRREKTWWEECPIFDTAEMTDPTAMGRRG
jgi:hypothetical protein